MISLFESLFETALDNAIFWIIVGIPAVLLWTFGEKVYRRWLWWRDERR